MNRKQELQERGEDLLLMEGLTRNERHIMFQAFIEALPDRSFDMIFTTVIINDYLWHMITPKNPVEIMFSENDNYTERYLERFGKYFYPNLRERLYNIIYHEDLKRSRGNIDIKIQFYTEKMLPFLFRTKVCQEETQKIFEEMFRIIVKIDILPKVLAREIARFL